MKNSLKIILISLIISVLVTPIQALSPQKKLASFVNQLKNEVYQFKKCFTKGENCGPKRKKIYKTIAAIVGILAVATAIGTGFYLYGQRKKQGEMQKKIQEIDFSKFDPKELNQQFINAVKTGDLILVQAWLEKVTDLNAKNNLGQNALMNAVWYGSAGVVKLLLANKNITKETINAHDTFNNNTLMMAATGGHTDVVKLLLANKNITKETINAHDNLGVNALMYASSGGHTDVVKLLFADRRITKETINAHDKLGVNALMMAARGGHTDVVKLLLADRRITKETINANNKTGLNALMYASSGGHTDVVKLLLADENITKEAIRKALTVAQDQEIIRILKEKLTAL